MEIQEKDKEILFLIEINNFLIDCYNGNYNRDIAISIIEQDKAIEPLQTFVKNFNPDYKFYKYEDAPDDVLLNKVFEIKNGIEKS